MSPLPCYPSMASTVLQSRAAKVYFFEFVNRAGHTSMDAKVLSLLSLSCGLFPHDSMEVLAQQQLADVLAAMSSLQHVPAEDLDGTYLCSGCNPFSLSSSESKTSSDSQRGALLSQSSGRRGDWIQVPLVVEG
ncbi:MAG: hypothetical protein EP343_27680 [Deltaproteobacteria bacterium]|nr:MAG: hypothetical protein EP343_27680 [Deltaproteobacteria bacterium]